MLQSLKGELNYFGAKDDTCHKVLLKYLQLEDCFESASYIRKILRSGNTSFWITL